MPKVSPCHYVRDAASAAMGTAETRRGPAPRFQELDFGESSPKPYAPRARLPGWFAGWVHAGFPRHLNNCLITDCLQKDPSVHLPAVGILSVFLSLLELNYKNRERSAVLLLRIKLKKNGTGRSWCPGQRPSSWGCGFLGCFTCCVRDQSLEAYKPLGLQLVHSAFLATMLDWPWLS